MKVIVYGKPACARCVTAINLLESRGIEHDYIDITKDEGAYDYVVDGFARLGVSRPEAPGIDVDNKFVGGLDALIKELSEEK